MNLRRHPQLSPIRFLTAHPGCWVVYRHDLPDRAATLPLQSPAFDPEVARTLQVAGWGVFYTLQAFGAGPDDAGGRGLRNFGVEVTLASPQEDRAVSPHEMERRKEEYFRDRLLRFPLRPHWLTETRDGFQAVFRIRPVRGEREMANGLVVNRWLAAALGGDAGAVRPTQTLRVPGTWQFTDPHAPFLCRVLKDCSVRTPPYGVAALSDALAEWRGRQRAGDGPSFFAAC